MLVWLLFNALVGLALILVVCSVQRIKKLTPALVHTIWLLVLLRMIAPPVPTWATGFGSAAATPPPALIQSGAPAYQREMVDWMTSNFGNNWSGAIVTLLITMWALGCLFVVARELLRERTLRNAVVAGAPASRALALRLQRAATRIDLPRDLPEVRMLQGIESPFLWSPLSAFGRNAFCVVPAHVHELPDSVLAHELVHLKRRDHWVAWAEFMALGIFWWNPLVHFVRRRLLVASELACDAEVLDHYPEERQAYATALVETLERGSGHWPHPALGTARAVGWSARELTQRLDRILAGRVPTRPRRGVQVMIATCALLTLPGLAAPDLAQFSDWLPSIPNELSDRRAHESLIRADLQLAEDPTDGAAAASRGRALIALGRMDAAAVAFERQLELGHRPGNANYNRACALAMAGRKREAVASLAQALALGIPVDFAVHDQDLASLQDLPEFQRLIAP